MTIFEIRARLDRHKMACIPGCTDCCGPVPFSETEADLVVAKWPFLARPGAVGPSDGDLKCGFVSGGKCAIHSERPFMCRLFGTSTDPRLRCPHGRRPRKMITTNEARDLTAAYTETLR